MVIKELCEAVLAIEFLKEYLKERDFAKDIELRQKQTCCM
jgi:hypothetical protein